MNKQSNSYIIIYATVLVVVVAAMLAFAAIQLQPMQQANIKIEKMGAILSSIGQGMDAAELAKNKTDYVEQEYAKYIVDSYLVDASGEKVEGDAFATLDNLGEAIAAGTYPVFVAKMDNGKTEYIIPVTGKGLWGPVWGYIALDEDCNTVLGAEFDHAGETPGLGAEISLTPFESQFIGKKLFDENGKFVSIALTKGVGSSAGNEHAVDAVSGGTLTSNGVQAMLKDCLQNYVPFFKKVTTESTSAPAAPAPVADTTQTEGGAE